MIIKYEIQRSKRKTLSLFVLSNGKILIKAPLTTSDSAIQKFVTEKSEWIAKKQAFACAMAQKLPKLKSGEKISIAGNIYTICLAEISRVRCDGEVLYLPVNSDENQSVESQEKDENSLLNTVRELIAIRKEYSCLNAEGDFIVIEDGYPFIYERKDQNDSVIVLINPSDNNYQREIAYSKVIKAVNAQLDGESVTLGAQSFVILKK